MKKWLSLAVFGCLFTLSWGQVESVGPITVMPTGVKKTTPKRANNPIDSSFVYLSDTLAVGSGIIDDFSSSKFQVFDDQPGAANVSEELWYKLMTNDATPVPVHPDSAYVGYQTFRKTVSGGVTTTAPFPARQIRVGDFSSFPVAYTLKNLYPRYDIIDSADVAGDLPDTVLVPVEYAQDSARIFTATLDDPRYIWMDRYVDHNYWSAVSPWTLGVATFDGLDETGYPYNFGSPTTGVADYLTSKYIDLSPFGPEDSVYLSFLVQRQGFCDAPEASDSLILEFYNTGLGTWHRVWSINGGPQGDFMVGHIKITQADYLTEAFRFRFKNYGGLSGALDQFHLDYIKLRDGSGYQDTLFKDFALVYPISNLIEDYTQVPWDHWQNDPRMSKAVRVVVRNGSNIDENNQDGTVGVAYNGTIVTPTPFILDRDTLSWPDFNYEPRTTYTSYHDFRGGYEYNQAGVEEADFEIIGWAGAQYSNPTFNDSSFYIQHFGDVYAYDDGSAEKAYGPMGVQARLAYKFTPYENDSIIAVRMRFVPSVVDVSENLFLLTVWADNAGVPGAVLYEDTYLRTPEYKLEGDGFVDYFLEDTLRLSVGSTFYVGWRQVEQERLNIGLDMNNDNSDKIFFSVNGGASWSNSMYDASLLIRPVFSTTHNYDLSVNETTEVIDWEVYPNPTTGQIAIRWDGMSAFPGAIVMDAQGRIVSRIETAGQFTDLQDAPTGIYFVQVNGLNGPVKKLIRY